MVTNKTKIDSFHYLNHDRSKIKIRFLLKDNGKLTIYCLSTKEYTETPNYQCTPSEYKRKSYKSFEVRQKDVA